MNKNWLKYCFIVCILLKMTLSIFYPVSGILLFVLLCFMVVSFLKAIIQMFQKNKNVTIKNLSVMVLILFLCFFPTYEQIEKMRFYSFEKQYTKLAHEMEKELLKEENTDGQYKK